MNRLTSGLAAIALLAVGLPVSARADQPGPDWMPAQQVIDMALRSGYAQVGKLKADDGRWEGEGTKNGRKMEFHADPRTGQITQEKPDD